MVLLPVALVAVAAVVRVRRVNRLVVTCRSEVWKFSFVKLQWKLGLFFVEVVRICLTFKQAYRLMFDLLTAVSSYEMHTLQLKVNINSFKK